VLPFTPRIEMVLSLAIFLAEQDEAYEIGENHLLMALLQEGEGVPVRKLIDMGFISTLAAKADCRGTGCICIGPPR